MKGKMERREGYGGGTGVKWGRSGKKNEGEGGRGQISIRDTVRENWSREERRERGGARRGWG